MSYRDALDSLRARRAALEAELTQARAAARESEALAKRISSLERELAQTNRMLGATAPAKRFLDTVQVAAPCTARWEDMKGDDRVRYCTHCEKNVYNLSALPEAEAEALVREREGAMCVRFYRRADGTTLTSDCPVGVRRRRRRRAVGAVAAGALVASAVVAGSTRTSDRHVMGDIGARQPPPPPPTQVFQEVQGEIGRPLAPAEPGPRRVFGPTGVR
jgi:hypothetical protein